MAKLTTHILDTANGIPAAGVTIRLYSIGTQRELLSTSETNADGRTNDPLLDQTSIRTGQYELEFDIGDYFAGRGASLSEPRFLDTVVIRCSLRDDESYHVPLLASPWSYSTYRGS